MKLYTIKLEDKAAVLNRLKAAKINVPSYKIHNDNIDKTFNISIEDPTIQATFEKILNGSPRIDVISIKDLKEILRKIVRRKLQEWKIERNLLSKDAPKEAEEIVKAIKKALIEQLDMFDFNYKVNDSEVKIDIIPYNSNDSITLEADLEIDDDVVRKLKPNKIEVNYGPYPPGSVYKSKDTTGIIDIFNTKYYYEKKIIESINDAWYNYVTDPRNFYYD